MDNPLWERILVDWVNCLKLSNHIQKLEDIKNGLFFSSIHRVIKNCTEIDCDILTCIFGILSEHYPEFIIANKSVVHLSDLPKIDLCGITSLLMHYTCIHDRKDVLTSPLCYNLQEFTQIKIRNFLERVQDCPKLNNAELASIITECMEDNRSQNWLCHSHQSPLQDVLKTPIMKSSKLFERDKEIAKLKCQLELIQEEKENIEKDLKNQFEKNKKLEKQLTQKTSEITNLRSEVLELEGRTPPHYRDKDCREMQKILRSKVDSLEQILEQSDKDNLKLREENDKGIAQIKQLEGRCNTWLEKFIDADKNLQLLNENYKDLQLKNKSLQAHCTELEAFLEEFKPKSLNESLNEDNFQIQSRRSRGFELQSTEDLAHSVVDIQLKEIQKENDNLKTTLDEIQDNCNQLSVERNTLILEKETLSKKIEHKEQEICKIEIINNDLMKQIECVIKEKSDIIVKLNAILESNIQTEQSLKTAINEKHLVDKHLKDTSLKLEEFSILNSKYLESLTSVNKEKDTLEENIRNLNNEIKYLTVNCDELKNTIKKIVEEKEDMVKELQSKSNLLLVTTSQLNETRNDKIKLIEEFDTLSANKNRLLIDLEALKGQLDVITNDYTFLLAENKKINEDLKSTLVDKQQLEEITKSLKVSLDKKINVNNHLDEKLKIALLEKNDLLNKNNSLSNDLIAEHQHIKQLGDEISNLMVELHNCKKDRDNLINASYDSEKQLQDVLRKNEDLDKHLEKTIYEKSQLSDELKLLSKKFGHLEEECKNLQFEKDKMNENINTNKMYVKELESKMDELFKQQKELEEKKSNIFEQLKSTTETMSKIEESLTTTKREKQLVEQNLKEISLKYEESSLLISQYLEKLNIVEADKSTSEKKMNNLQNEKEILLKQNEELNITVQQITIEKNDILVDLENKTKLVLEITSLLNETQNEKLRVSEQLAIISSSKDNLLIDFNNLEKNLTNLVDEKDTLFKENINLLNMLKDITNDKHLLNEQCKLLKGTLDETVSKKNGLNEELNRILNENKNILKEKNLLNDIINDMQMSLDKVNMEVINLSENLIKCEKDRGALIAVQNKLEDTLNKNTILNKNLEQAVSEKCLLSEELKMFTCKHNHLEIDFTKLQSEKQALIENMNLLKLENSQILDKLDQVTKSLEDAVNEFAQENKLLTEKLNKEADVLQKAILEKENILVHLKDIENECLVKNKTIADNEATFETAMLAQMEISKTLKFDNITLSEKLVTISNENVVLKNTVTKMEEQCKSLSDNLLKLETKLNAFITEKESTFRKLEESKKIISDLSSSLQRLNQEKEDLILNAKNIEQKLITADAEVEIKTGKINQMREKLNEYRISQDQDFVEVTELKSKIESLNTEKNNLEISLKNALKEKDVISGFFNLNTNELQKVTQERLEILEALELSNKDVITLQEEKEAFLREIEKLSQIKKDFSDQLDKVSQEKADLSDQHQTILKKNFENSEIIKDLQGTVTKLSEENVEFLGKLTLMSNDLEEKSKNVEILQSSCKLLKKEVDDKSEILEKLSEEHKDIFDIVDRLSREKIDMNHTIDIISEEKMKLTQNINNLNNHIEQLVQEKCKLMQCLELNEKELQKVKKDRNDILEGQTKIMKETQTNLLMAHQSAVEVKNDLMKRIEIAETEKDILRKQVEQDTKNIQESYMTVVATNSKLELEIINLRKTIEDKNQKLNEFIQTKEAYEKLLEENNMLSTEIDTIKYKRSRDRDEFVNLLKKERENGVQRESQKIKEVRHEYEGKLEKMKEKMLKLYRDEVSKEMLKVKTEQSESKCLIKTIEDLRNELFEVQQKLLRLETERDRLRKKELQSNKHMHSASRESLRSLMDQRDSIRGSLTSLRSIGTNPKNRFEASEVLKKGRSTSVLHNNLREVDRKIVTLPRSNITEIQETVTISRRTSLSSVPNIEVEDEDDDFNNKYLIDLKAGKCIVNENGKERFSELAWRNSMVPPHLKSSYPAETQFVSPSKFKEDDLKGGNVNMDDSLCKLLPGEKTRQKKDFGTTTYKKPGPPTPSKNGGRLSLQGNEVHPLREQNEKSPKKLTPSRLRSLFMGKTNIRDNSENQPVTPRTKQRLSIFRKQR